MAKRAFLVGFAPLTRVIVDVEDVTLEDAQDYSKVIRAARQQILDNGVAEYINGETCDRAEEDIECPYNPEEDD